MKQFKDVGKRGGEWIVACALGAAAALLYFCTMASCAYPGEGAHLMTLWKGLDSAAVNVHPLMAVFARMFGCSNILGPLCGIVSVLALYHLTSFFIRERIGGELLSQYADSVGRLAGIVASVIFMATPAVHQSFTHLSSFSFDAAWALVTASLLIPYARAGKKTGWMFPILIGVFVGLGFADSPLFGLLVPLYFGGVWAVSGKRGGKPYGAAFAFLLIAIITLFIYAPNASGNFTEHMRAHWNETKMWLSAEGWFLVAAFAIVPFVVALFSSFGAYNRESGLSQWIYHVAMSFVTILAVATPLAPSPLMRPYGLLPVVPCALAAFTAAYLVTYWWLLAVAKVRKNESIDAVPVSLKGRTLALAALPVLSLVMVITVFLNLFSFDRSRGDFADRTAEKLIADLGDRTWFITDGLLDDHLRLAAAKAGKELNLVCLQRDLDERYLGELAKLVEEKGIGGEKNRELSISLSLGVLAFVQDWFAADPDIAKKAAIFGAPDLWYAAGIKAVPEFFFFGADPACKPDWSAWSEFDAILAPPKGVKEWGSYRLWKENDPIELARLRLRRHVGLVANDRGVWLQDVGDNDGAFNMYELVLNSIDRDNVCALFNEFEMARAGHSKAVRKKNDIEKVFKAIVEDRGRRYVLWKLANVYGYIRNPEIFVRLGFAWAKSGRPGEALNQIRRAIDFVPTERRSSLLNMMAALYASDSDVKKSRATYEEVLSKDAENHDALVGLMRLELLEGNSARAIEYLERATKTAQDDPRVAIEVAMLHLMKNELSEAKAMLTRSTDLDPANLQAWSLLAAVSLQQFDASKDPAERAKLLKNVENVILPEMEKNAKDVNDYSIQSTRAFLLLRQGNEKRKAARDMFAAAIKARPEVQATQDIVLGLDIALNDTADAEYHAREVLRRNRKAPLANYVMGSLALQKGKYEEAETFLRRACETTRPVVLAQNDLAEVLRRTKRLEEAERYARLAVRTAPELYVAWETLGSILLDANGDLNEAEQCISKACDLSKSESGKEEDVRMLIALARVQIAKGDRQRANMTIRKIKGRVKELSEFERGEFEELSKSVR
ncbi:MAG: tetratricopeptide repeat protein [Kiritimatiellae bacterium]|nr:tetratricopeptide repeat protein [Kiritimatiellia bacterium]